MPRLSMDSYFLPGYPCKNSSQFLGHLHSFCYPLVAVIDDSHEDEDSDVLAVNEADMEIEKSVQIDLQKRPAFLPSPSAFLQY